MNEQIEINITETYKLLEQINYPSVFIFNLITNKSIFSDYELSIILRLFIKTQSNYILEVNLKSLFSDELDKKSHSWKVLKEFYKIIKKKMSLVFVLKKFSEFYCDQMFWAMTINNQQDYLLKKKEHFQSVFDCSKGGTLFHYKLAQIFKEKKYDKTEITNNIINRLLYLLDILGSNIFTALEIPLININDFLRLSEEDIINYLCLIYNKFIELFNQIIKLFDSYNLYCIQIQNIINPCCVKIESSNIDSETDNEDIIILSIK